jgi:hypothetical protein
LKAFKQLLLKAEEGVRAANEKLAERDTTVTKQKTHIRYLEEIVKLFKANKFGKSSEKSPAQTELFDEAEIEGCKSDQNLFAEAIESKEEAAPASVPSASTAKASRKPIPKDFSRIIVEYDLTNAENLCSCGCEKTHIGDEVFEQLDIVPAVIQVLQHRRKKYAGKNCKGQLQTASLQPQPIPKSNASSLYCNRKVSRWLTLVLNRKYFVAIEYSPSSKYPS